MVDREIGTVGRASGCSFCAAMRNRHRDQPYQLLLYTFPDTRTSVRLMNVKRYGMPTTWLFFEVSSRLIDIGRKNRIAKDQGGDRVNEENGPRVSASQYMPLRNLNKTWIRRA